MPTLGSIVTGTQSPSKIAERMLGTHEGRQHGVLTEYLKNGGANLDPRTTAWCAAFVNSTLAQAGSRGTGSNMARSFLKWGAPTQEPKPGDIAVFSRGDPRGAYGHVGFYQGRDANGNIQVLGGNQSDSVSVASYPAARLLGFRTAVPGQTGGEAPATQAGGGTLEAGGAPPITNPGAGPAMAAGPGATPGLGAVFAEALAPLAQNKLPVDPNALVRKPKQSVGELLGDLGKPVELSELG